MKNNDLPSSEMKVQSESASVTNNQMNVVNVSVVNNENNIQISETKQNFIGVILAHPIAMGLTGVLVLLLMILLLRGMATRSSDHGGATQDIPSQEAPASVIEDNPSPDVIDDNTSSDIGDEDTGITVGTHEASEDNMENTDHDERPAGEIKALSLTKMIESKNASVLERAENSLGDSFDNVIYIGLWNGYAKYFLDGKYERFMADISCGDEATVGYSYTVEVILDDYADIPAAQYRIGRSSKVTRIDLDVSGATYLTIRTRDNDQHQPLLISNGYLFSRANDYERVFDTASQPAKSMDIKPVKLSNCKLIEWKNVNFVEEGRNSLGYDLQGVICIGLWNGYARYFLNGEYERFVGCLSCGDEAAMGYGYSVEILADDEDIPVAKYEIRRTTPMQLIDIDVSGVDYLTIRTIDNDQHQPLFLSDAYLCRDRKDGDILLDQVISTDHDDVKDIKKLSFMHMVEQKNADFYGETLTSHGEKRFDAIVLGVWQGYVRYYLNGKYERLTANLDCGSRTKAGNSFVLDLYLDDQEIPAASYTVHPDSETIPIDIDVTDATILTIRTRDTGNYPEAVLSDCYLFVDAEAADMQTLRR